MGQGVHEGGAVKLGPLTLYFCTYLAGDGNRYGMTLWATTPEQLELEWVDKIIGFRVEGTVVEDSDN